MKRDLKKLILQNNHPNSCLVRENFNFQSDDDVGKQICNYLQTQTYITWSTARTTAFCGLGQPEKREDRAQCWDRLWRLLIEHRPPERGGGGGGAGGGARRETSLTFQCGLTPIIRNTSICQLYNVSFLETVHETYPWPQETLDLTNRLAWSLENF